MAKATSLKSLKLNELSFVDSPANRSARVTIFKRDDGGDERQTIRKSEGRAEDQLDALVKVHAKTHRLTFAKAMDEVLETDEGKALYRKMEGEPAPVAKGQPTHAEVEAQAIERSPALREIEKLAKAHAEAHKVTIEKARAAVLETPDGRRAYEVYEGEKRYLG